MERLWGGVIDNFTQSIDGFFGGRFFAYNLRAPQGYIIKDLKVITVTTASIQDIYFGVPGEQPQTASYAKPGQVKLNTQVNINAKEVLIGCNSAVIMDYFVVIANYQKE